MDGTWGDELRELTELLRGTPIVELELADGDLHIALKREPQARRTGAEAVGSGAAVDDDQLAYVRAPLLGTFFRSPSPGADPFVKEGDHLEKGQIVGLIEAMKIFNEIQAEVSGRVQAILVEDGSFVEAEQRLIAIDTQSAEDTP